ncbi:hypothetical protein EVAR_21169_1 [Eumeta japonica]|uniref:Uncharacterized protein n=1 Tax=Eumeta variegata TaxID=151549 RepID=A0A4C1UPA5_EUMVA|nr:hypothetical protein EVAR_21169_1 [Eumeta japonica]
MRPGVRAGASARARLGDGTASAVATQNFSQKKRTDLFIVNRSLTVPRAVTAVSGDLPVVAFHRLAVIVGRPPYAPLH